MIQNLEQTHEGTLFRNIKQHEQAMSCELSVDDKNESEQFHRPQGADDA